MDVTLTVGMADAKTNFSRITSEVNRTGIPVTVFKNNKPWVEIRPLSKSDDFASLPSETLDAMDETEAASSDPSHKTYRTAEDVFSALGI